MKTHDARDIAAAGTDRTPAYRAEGADRRRCACADRDRDAGQASWRHGQLDAGRAFPGADRHGHVGRARAVAASHRGLRCDRGVAGGLIGARVSGLPLAEVNVNVGDIVKRGQVLARFDTSMVRAELAEAEARLVQAQAETKQAAVNRDRALSLRNSGALSEQQILQYVTQADTAQAQQGVAEASLAAARIKLDNTRVVAPDDGVISARNATLGQVADAQSGAQLFKLIRQGRLEWRGELTPAQLSRVHAGNPVLLTLPDGTQAAGDDPAARAGARSDVAAGHCLRSTCRRAAVLARPCTSGAASSSPPPMRSSFRRQRQIRDGRSYVFVVDGNRVRQLPVTTGRRVGSQIEIVQGMTGNERIAVRRRRLPERRRPRVGRVGQRSGPTAMSAATWSIRNPIPAIMLFVLLTLGGALEPSAR